MKKRIGFGTGMRVAGKAGCWLWFVGLLVFGVATGRGATLTLGTLVPEGTSYYRSLEEMAAQWRKLPSGPRLRIHAGGKLGGEAKMVSQMRLGGLDAGLLTAVGLSEIEPGVVGLQSIPMAFHSLDEVDYVGEKLKPLLEARLAAKGFVVLFWTDAGWVRFFSKDPLMTPEELKRMKMFTWAGDSATVDLWKKTGFNPVPLETANIVPMLDTGLINVVAMPPVAALAGQVHDRAPHMLELNWAPLIGALVMRKDQWDRIPEATRKQMLEIAAATGAENRKQGRAENEKSVKVMQDRGLKVHPVTPEMEAQWRAVAEKVYPEMKGKLVPADIFDRVMSLLEEYRKAQGTTKP